MNVLVGGAWPYANGSLHIGHLAALLPGDVLARYHRAKGDEVCYVSGSDCYGTPVAIRARQEGSTPAALSDLYHREFASVFTHFGFSYDLYSKTSSPGHIAFVREFHQKLYEGPYVYPKQTPQLYCDNCKLHLADRFVTGLCPVCGKPAKGEQCDICGTVLEAQALREPVCSLCGQGVSLRSEAQLYLALTKLAGPISEYIAAHSKWRKTALDFSNRYLSEGLRDRSITRSLDWGIDVPLAGFEDKKIYIWAENVLGYLSASKEVCEKTGQDYDALWHGDARHYYVHGKDNVPFHTMILPGLLLAQGGRWRLPDECVSSCHLTLDGRKISTSDNHAIWAKDLMERVNPDALRYFLLANGPEKRDADFTWRAFALSQNSELAGAYGNFVHRTLVFIEKYREGQLPPGSIDDELWEKTQQAFPSVGNKIERGLFKDAIKEIFELVRAANQYYDRRAPWIARTENPAHCNDTLYTCVQLIANLATLLRPFLPFSSEKIGHWLHMGEDFAWKPCRVSAGLSIEDASVLFARFES